MDAQDLEEANRLRVSLGMKPLPVPGGSTDGPAYKEKAQDAEDGDGEPASTLETREAAAYDNYKKVMEAEAAKKKREEKLAAIKKARDAAKRAEVFEGKGLGDADDDNDVSAKAWLKSQSKRQKKIDQARKYEEQLAAAEAEALANAQYTSKDLAGVRVGHEATAFEDGDAYVMTLKDTNVLDEEDGDELENADLRDKEKLNRNLELKKKKPVYDVHATIEDGEQSLLAQYDEDMGIKRSKRFTLDASGTGSGAQTLGDMAEQAIGQRATKINLDILEDGKPNSDYLDISEIKVKKPKKKKSKSTRKRPADDDDIFPTEPAEEDHSMEVDSGAGFISKKRKTDDSALIDDEDLQATLSIQRRAALKKRKRVRPEDLARQLKEEANNDDSEDFGDLGEGGLVLDETSEFVSNLKKEDIEERRPRPKQSAPEPVTAMEEDSDEDERMHDGSYADEEPVKREESPINEAAVIGVDEEKTVGTGVGAALQLLRERNLISQTNSSDLNNKLRQREAFIAEKKTKIHEIEEAARRQRERDRASGRLDRMTVREREEYARQQNNARDLQASRQLAEIYKTSYVPNVELKYHDEFGRSLDAKEAFKHLSHAFHGKGSGKGKTDKRLKKIEDERRREAQSFLDDSQNVGMSSATAQQTKKNKQAGVRLA
ncbi:SART-1 protein [Microdochium trichocladiopsis]|uniref:SART-1 protein n=1 Tax=Microdochium trichocladiopsis TaxID=1682393 RepID=A0A9P8YK16_9PEZI|nr:SART-1 protein [Microdochium trichocladiopsis]KAH7040450.1 SART-1 protein [Microdochium trichocladiopsis]